MPMQLSAALALERRIAVDHMQSDDVRIGLAAFRSRQEPLFTGH